MSGARALGTGAPEGACDQGATTDAWVPARPSRRAEVSAPPHEALPGRQLLPASQAHGADGAGPGGAR